MKIESFKYHRIEKPYCFWNIIMIVDGAYHKMYLSDRQLEGLDMPLVDAVCFLLRADLECEPIQEKTRTFDDT